MRFPRTLSARIVVGFAVLLLTSAAFSVSTVVTIDRLNRAIRIIYGGYLQMALASRDLADRQDALRAYLRDDLSGESSLRRLRNRLKTLRGNREKMLGDAEEVLRRFRDAEGEAGQHLLGRAERSLAQIRADVDATRSGYERLLAAPPIETDTAPTPAEARATTDEALKRLLLAEGRVKGLTDWFKAHLSDEVKKMSGRLETFSQRVRWLQILWGITVLFLGGLVMIWTTLTLRPLRLLQSGARRIAEGSYAERIDVKGPTDIADLAREFNAMARAIRDRERELVRTERLATVGKMAAMITHEVRNPLSSIGLNTELLEEELGALPPERAAEARSLVAAIISEIDRLTDITEEYLTFAGLPKPKLRLESVGKVVADLVEFEREALRHRGVRLILELSPKLPSVRLDEAQIRQALRNLIRNAAEAASERDDPLVTVGGAADGAAVRISVRDNGNGVPEEMLDKLFEPFASAKKGGTGLGLALSQQIAREHGGELEVVSHPGEGATFTLELPAKS